MGNIIEFSGILTLDKCTIQRRNIFCNNWKPVLQNLNFIESTKKLLKNTRIEKYEASLGEKNATLTYLI